MDRNQATHEAFDGVEVRLSSGKVVHCQPLTVREAVHWLRRLSEVENTEDVRAMNEALLEFLESFPAAVGIEDEHIPPAEVMEVARSFLRRPTWSSAGRARTTTGTTETSATGSNSTPVSTT